MPADRARATPSLRATLLRWLLLPLLVIAPLGAALQYVLTLKPASEAFDQALGDTVIAVANFVRADDDGRVLFEMSAQTERSLRTDQFDTVYYAVFAADGALVAGDTTLSKPPLALPAGAWRFFDSDVEGQPVRVGAHGVACGAAVCQVRVAETRLKRDRVQADALIATLLTIVALALAMALVIVVAAGRGLAPLTRLSQQLAARSLNDLRPLQAGDAPREVQGVVESINRLFNRLRHSADAQQQFLADAAHQLRTPLSVLKTETELALLEPHSPALAVKLHRLDDAAGRAARLASQLLALARADASAQGASPEEDLDLAALAHDAGAEWVPRALQAGIDLGFELQPARQRGRGYLLRELIANLLHNAIEYTGRGAFVTLRTGRSAAGSWLEVEDDGPGIAPPERTAVFERFRRGRDVGGSGSGLGLAIVSDIAHAHGAEVTLADGADGRGLRVRVQFAAGT
jgi:two-component system, OmpR family, sensor histidine kinase TctE